MTQATINKNPTARLFGEPEVVESVEIGHVLQMLKDLSDMARLVNERPDNFCDGAKLMAYLIQEIERGVMPPHLRP